MLFAYYKTPYKVHYNFSIVRCKLLINYNSHYIGKECNTNVMSVCKKIRCNVSPKKRPPKGDLSSYFPVFGPLRHTFSGVFFEVPVQPLLDGLRSIVHFLRDLRPRFQVRKPPVHDLPDDGIVHACDVPLQPLALDGPLLPV